jgi:hypothetical protein
MQVVDRHERQLARGRDRLRGRHADEQRADQARPAGDRDLGHVVERRARCLERVVQHGVDQLQVVAGRDLGHHAAVADDRCTRVVAARLDGEDHAAGCASATVRHMITASSLLSW